ncbi:MAG TPA: DUF2974 domain-containing protein [Clostridiales bacterium]|nr:DUF2974 domain-containing protein [Clostridiales bacterium]
MKLKYKFEYNVTKELFVIYMELTKLVTRISEQMENQINTSAVLSKYSYLHTQDKKYENNTLDEIINTLKSKSSEYKSFIKIIEEKPDLAKIKLIGQSNIDYEIPIEHLDALIYEDIDKAIYIVFRGTGDGKWIDNGDGLTKESSFMQKVAMEFFNIFIEKKYLYDYQGKEIIVTGHSKGGNLAQFITMSSIYSDLIYKTYSFDGQGFSKLAVENFKINLDYIPFYNQINKIYAINGQNDFISPLGYNIVEKDKYFFIKTPNNINSWHNISQMLEGAKLNWIRDEDGNIIIGESGPVWRYASELSKDMMELEGEDLDDLVITVMSFFEALLPYQNIIGGKYKYGTGDRAFMSKDDFIGFLTNGLPSLIRNISKRTGLTNDKYLLIYDK